MYSSIDFCVYKDQLSTNQTVKIGEKNIVPLEVTFKSGEIYCVYIIRSPQFYVTFNHKNNTKNSNIF